MTVRQVAAAIQAALDRLPADLLGRARAHLGEAEQTLSHALSGSPQPEARRPLTELAEARQALAAVEGALQRVHDLMDRYLAALVGGAAPATPAPAPRADPAVPGERRPYLDRGRDGDRVERILRELPPPVPRPNPRGRKTHGRVIGDDDGEIITSGHDSDSEAVWQLLQERGVDTGYPVAAITHVEMKVAYRMIRAIERHTTLVINNRPCEGVYGCEVLLPVLLPEGYSITVHGPDYRETFHGGEQW